MNPADGLDEAEPALISRARAGESLAFAVLMRRTNRRLYRVIACVIREQSEIEETIQQAYFSAFLHFEQFAGRSTFATWVTRIALHQALASRKERVRAGLEVEAEEPRTEEDPERRFSAGETGAAIHDALASLSERDRLVFVLRELEGLSFANVAESLEVSEDAAKMQFYRARVRLGDDLIRRLGASREELLSFGGETCERIVAATLAHLEVPQVIGSPK